MVILSRRNNNEHIIKTTAMLNQQCPFNEYT